MGVLGAALVAAAAAATGPATMTAGPFRRQFPGQGWQAVAPAVRPALFDHDLRALLPAQCCEPFLERRE